MSPKQSNSPTVSTQRLEEALSNLDGVRVNVAACQHIVLPPPTGDDPLNAVPQHLGEAATYGLLLALNAINFCYFPDPGQPAWTWQGKHGFLGMLRCAIDHPDPHCQARGLRDYLTTHGDGLPLLPQRLAALDEVIRVFPNDDKILDFYDYVKGRAETFVYFLAMNCPSFVDELSTSIGSIPMYKRAWLIGMFVERLAKTRPLPLLEDSGRNALCIDYRLPVACRRLKLLELDPDLAARIDHLVPITANCRIEHALRIGTALVLRHLLAAHPDWTPADLDARLFALGGAAPDGIVHHRTRTTAY